MRIALFCHSLVSDWNHGNAHFLRGVATELMDLGHEVRVWEPQNGWSRENLLRDQGPAALDRFHSAYPGLSSRFYDDQSPDLDAQLDGADLVIVHEWNRHSLVKRLGEYRQRANFRLLFHDTHHRSVTDPDAMANYDLNSYDGVLAFGESVREIYLRQGWASRVWTWHEAADVRVFYPRKGETPVGDLVWIGNWGDEERSRELDEYLFSPSRDLSLRTRVFGVRYPPAALQRLNAAGIVYGGWLANFDVPRVFAQYRMTVHVPRQPYAQALRGIPTIRPFEALACGIPLVCAPWYDSEGLFREGRDYLTARTGSEMRRLMLDVLSDSSLAGSLAAYGRETILARHTCAHRARQLLTIAGELRSAHLEELETAV